MPKFIDLSGQRFTNLVVLQRVKNHGKQTMWLCQCDCGKTRIVQRARLRSRKTRSCGCLLGKNRPRLMDTKTPEYNLWHNILQRCHNPKHPSYHNYGGRGIVVIERWHNSTFFLQDITPRPSSKHTFERIDNDGPYAPGNVRWATRKEQLQNTRRTPWYVHNGVRRTLQEWCVLYGKNVPMVRYRMQIMHWDFDRAITIPSGYRKRNRLGQFIAQGSRVESSATDRKVPSLDERPAFVLPQQLDIPLVFQATDGKAPCFAGEPPEAVLVPTLVTADGR